MSRRSFVCRCEDVTRAEVDAALQLGLQTIEEIKRYTGAGTGPCQGKECMVTLARHMITQGVDPQTLAPFTARPPAEPVTFGALAAMAEPSPKTDSGSQEEP